MEQEEQEKLAAKMIRDARKLRNRMTGLAVFFTVFFLLPYCYSLYQKRKANEAAAAWFQNELPSQFEDLTREICGEELDVVCPGVKGMEISDCVKKNQSKFKGRCRDLLKDPNSRN